MAETIGFQETVNIFLSNSLVRVVRNGAAVATSQINNEVVSNGKTTYSLVDYVSAIPSIHIRNQLDSGALQVTQSPVFESSHKSIS